MGYGRSGLCGDSGISLRPLPAILNSFNMSSQLLQVCVEAADGPHDQHSQCHHNGRSMCSRLAKMRMLLRCPLALAALCYIICPDPVFTSRQGQRGVG